MGERIKAGDIVHHKPSDEVWFVLGVNYATGKLCVAGWPPTVADIADCEYRGTRRPLREDEINARQRMFGGGWE
jgi:hypothetical protein